MSIEREEMMKRLTGSTVDGLWNAADGKYGKWMGGCRLCGWLKVLKLLYFNGKKKIRWSRISITAYGHAHIRILDRGLRVFASRFVNVCPPPNLLYSALGQGCLREVWKMSGRCLEGVWKVSGVLESVMCLQSVWKVSEGLPKISFNPKILFKPKISFDQNVIFSKIQKILNTTFF